MHNVRLKNFRVTREKLIPAIKFVRWATGSGLKDAKDLVDAFMRSGETDLILKTNKQRNEVEAELKKYSDFSIDCCEMDAVTNGSFSQVADGVFKLSMQSDHSSLEMYVEEENLLRVIHTFLHYQVDPQTIDKKDADVTVE